MAHLRKILTPAASSTAHSARKVINFFRKWTEIFFDLPARKQAHQSRENEQKCARKRPGESGAGELSGALQFPYASVIPPPFETGVVVHAALGGLCVPQWHPGLSPVVRRWLHAGVAHARTSAIVIMVLYVNPHAPLRARGAEKRAPLSHGRFLRSNHLGFFPHTVSRKSLTETQDKDTNCM